MADLTLPGDDFVPGWKKTSRLHRFKESDLFNYINGGAEIFHEFGFHELFVQRYGKDDAEITLEVYRMQSPESALGIYLMKCGKETTVVGVPARHSGNRFQFTIVKSNYYILVNNSNGDETGLPIMVSLSQIVLNSIPQGKPVELFRVLPKKNLISGSERIIRGPYGLEPIYTFGEGDNLQLRGRVFALVGDYRNDGGRVYTRIMIPYPDRDSALAAYQSLVTNLDPYSKVLDEWKGGFVFRDYRDRYGIAEIQNFTIDIKINLSEQPVQR